MDRICRALVTSATLMLSACHATQWAQESSIHGQHWRDRQAFVFDQDVILARNDSSAEDALQTIGQVRAAIIKDLGHALPPTLWIAMGPAEDALADDIPGLMTALGKDASAGDAKRGGLGQAMIGRGGNGRTGNGRSARAPTPAEEQRLILLISRSLTMPVNLEKTELNLPLSILAQVDAVILYATDTGLEAVAEQMLDMILEMQDLSVLESATLFLARGMVVGELAKKLIEQRQRALADWIRQSQRFDGDDRDTQLAILAKALGLPVEGAEPED